MILKDECKKIKIKVSDFSIEVGVPSQTLRDWCISKPLIVQHLLNSVDLTRKMKVIDEEIWVLTSTNQNLKDSLVHSESLLAYKDHQIKELSPVIDSLDASLVKIASVSNLVNVVVSKNDIETILCKLKAF